MTDLRILAGAVLLTFALAVLCLVTRRPNPLDEAEIDEGDLWLSRVSKGALNFHDSKNMTGAERNNG